MRLREFLEKMDAQIDKMSISIAEIKKDLNYHIKRTDLLEEEIKPVKKHVVAVNTLFKAALILLGAIGTIAGVIKLFI